MQNPTPPGVSIEAFQIQVLLEHIGEQAKVHARDIMNVRTQHAMQLQQAMSPPPPRGEDSTPDGDADDNQEEVKEDG